MQKWTYLASNTRLLERAAGCVTFRILQCVGSPVEADTQIYTICWHVVTPEETERILDLRKIGMRIDERSDLICGRIPAAMDIVGHQVDEVDMFVYLIDLEPAKVPVRSWRGK